MATEDAARQRADADAAGKLQQILDGLKTLGERVAATTARLDSMDRKDAEEDKLKQERESEKASLDAKRARHDAARKDRFGARKDGEKFADYKGRHDADEMAMCDALEKDGDDKEVAREDAKRTRKDAEEAEARADKDFEKWAKEETEEPEHREDRARKDAEDKVRADAALAGENATLKARLEALTAEVRNITRETPAEERDALAQAQARADGVAAMFGERVAQPNVGETSLSYRRRLLQKFQRHSPQFKDGRFDSTDAATLTLIENAVYADAQAAATAVAGARPGILIPHITRDSAGREITRYHGDISAWMAPFMSGSQSGRINRNAKGA